jgi:hypothetical protein
VADNGRAMLVAFYETTPCEFCRESIVRKLIKDGALPDYIAAECAYDSNQDLRALIGGIDKNLRP